MVASRRFIYVLKNVEATPPVLAMSGFNYRGTRM
jgi:hypothetical protein